MARYLTLDDVCAGDLCLSSDATLQSRLLRLSMWSRYSHAAIMIHPLIWFESVGEGVGYKLLEPSLIWDGKRIRLATRLEEGQRVIVRRPIGLAEEDESEFNRHLRAKRLMQISGQYAFLNYARLEDFLSMARLRIGDSEVVERIQNALKEGRDTIFDGPSCANLSSLCYRDLGYELPMDPRKTTPGQLARSEQFITVAEPIEAELIKVLPHWKDFYEQLDRSMSVVRTSLAATSIAANLTKKGKGVFDKFNWNTLTNLANRAPSKYTTVAAYNREIRETFLADFAVFRNAAVMQLSPAYCSLTQLTDKIHSLSECAFECKKKKFRPEDNFCEENGWCIEHKLESDVLKEVFGSDN